MRLFLLVATVASLAVLRLSGAAFLQDDAVKEREKFQGVWRIESAEEKGAAKPEVLGKLTLTFKGDQLIPSDNIKDILTFKLDPSKKPATIDLTERASDAVGW